MNDAEIRSLSISFEKYLDFRLDLLDERFLRLEEAIKHETVLREAYFKSANEALRLQAVEYERRLEALNHENTRILQAQARSVSSERYEAYVASNEQRINERWEEHSKWRESINILLAEERGGRQRQAWLLGIAFSILALLMKFIPIGIR